MSQPDPLLARCLRWLGPRRPSAGRLRAMVDAAYAAGLAPATVNRHLSALRKHWPGLAVPWQREPRGRTTTVSPADLERLVAALYPPYAHLVTFLAETGMRVGEVLALRAEDVELDRHDGSWATVADSKNGDSRRVPLTAAAVRAWEIAGPWWISRSGFQHAFRKAAAALGLAGLRPHDLRHTCASRLTNAGVPLQVVGAMLGHRDYRSTLRYSHVGTQGLRMAREALEHDAPPSGPYQSPPIPLNSMR